MVEILDKIIELCKLDPGLSEIKDYHRFNGMFVAKRPTMSVGFSEEEFKDYTSEEDESELKLSIYIYLDNPRPEEGHLKVWELARRCRKVLSHHYTLGGLVEDSFVRRIRDVYPDDPGATNLHAVIISFEVNSLVDRLFSSAESGEEIYPVDEVNNSIEEVD